MAEPRIEGRAVLDGGTVITVYPYSSEPKFPVISCHGVPVRVERRTLSMFCPICGEYVIVEEPVDG